VGVGTGGRRCRNGWKAVAVVEVGVPLTGARAHCTQTSKGQATPGGGLHHSAPQQDWTQACNHTHTDYPNRKVLRFWAIAVTMAVKPVGYNLMRRLYSVLYIYYLPNYLEYSTLF
jgi:hypothetical protein